MTKHKGIIKISIEAKINADSIVAEFKKKTTEVCMFRKCAYFFHTTKLHSKRNTKSIQMHVFLLHEL